MSRFLMAMWDGGGVVPPELGLARRLIARGHAVDVIGDPTLEPEVRAAGCGFRPWTTAPHRTVRTRDGDLLRDYAGKNPIAYLREDVYPYLGGGGAAFLADTLAALDGGAYDAVLADWNTTFSMLAGKARGLPVVGVVPNVALYPTPGVMPPGAAPGWPRPLAAVRDAVLRRLVERVFDGMLGYLNHARASVGMPAVRHWFDELRTCDAVLVLTSPVFDPTSRPPPANMHWVGAQLDDPTWAPPYVSPFEPGDDRPLVLVGLSSTFMDQVGFLRRAVDALAGLPIRGLVCRGPAIGPDEVSGAANVAVVDAVPHAAVLPHTAVLVTHCGHGTALKGLAAGVPMACVPMGRDQGSNAARIVHAGAGLMLKKSASVERIRDTVRRLLHEPRFRDAARAMGARLAAREGEADPIAVVEGVTRRRAR